MFEKAIDKTLGVCYNDSKPSYRLRVIRKNIYKLGESTTMENDMFMRREDEILRAQHPLYAAFCQGADDD